MVVDPSGLGFDLEVPVEVVIGSVPFKSVAQQYGMDQSIDPPPTDAPTGLYTETSTGQFLNPLLPSVRKCHKPFLTIKTIDVTDG